MGTFNTKVAGVKQKNQDGTERQKYIIKYCKEGMPLTLIPEPDNAYDPNAISVWITAKSFFSSKSYQIGYISAEIADRLSGEMQRGKKVQAFIKDITGGNSDKAYGVNITIHA
ncbi:HIRAN domain-containing protein [Flavobacterium sp. W21_SRS_FM6]|uniref:HIRAN domain-containing protein n=1 Tax=Flavobacterium sp. W21_SRS_FM6 TaxID=3240268 RepID=UPI003F915388